MSSYDACTQITPECPVSATTYGYAPNLAANSILLAIFGICACLQVWFGWVHRTWTFMAFVSLGCFMELAGYVGRVIMHNNVWDSSGFRLQVVCLILAPSFIAAGIYLALKHIILYVGPEYSRLKPSWYTWIFIGCDILSFLMQATGGGIAASAGSTGIDLMNAGNDLMIAGIAFQVATMAICALLALDFAYRVYKKQATTLPYAETKEGLEDVYGRKNVNHKRFQIFCAAEVFAFVTVLIRCIYRLPEMVGGWGNPLMRKEAEFLILDGLMVALAAIAFTVFHPGFWFPIMGKRR